MDDSTAGDYGFRFYDARFNSRMAIYLRDAELIQQKSAYDNPYKNFPPVGIIKIDSLPANLRPNLMKKVKQTPQ